MQILRKYKETILYLFFGGLSTVINILVYYITTRFFSFNIILANIFAWIIAVIFAFITNKFFVFESKDKEFSYVLREVSSFIGYRVLSLIVEMVMMNYMINILLINDFIVKIFTNIIIIILNYLFSKIFIFKQRDE